MRIMSGLRVNMSILEQGIKKRYGDSDFFVSKKGKEKYCILRNKFPHNGVLATANQYLFMYQWAKERGYIPLMDWETIYNYKKRNIGF